MKNTVRIIIGLFFITFPALAVAQQIGCPETGCPIPPTPIIETVTASRVSANTVANTAVTLQFQAQSSSAQTLSYATSSNPTHGTLGTIGSDGTVVYTPNTDYVGHDSFDYTAAHGANVSSTTPVDIDIAAPTVTASDVSVTASTGAATTSRFAAVSSDNGTLTYATTSSPTHGTLAISRSTFTYTPDAAYTGSDSFTYEADEGTLASSTATVTITVAAPVETASLAIRDGSTLIGPVSLTLPDANATAVIAPTGSTTSYTVASRSVLALLSLLDAATTTFNIADLQYSNSFSSFLLNCIAVQGGAAGGDCFSWTYAVNGVFPAVGMDHTNLQNGDSAYVFFGDSIKVSTDKSTVNSGESITVTVQKYDPASGTYVADGNEVVGAVQFDSNFTATEFATSTTAADGTATLTLSSAGTYDVGTQNTGYFPNVSITVTVASTGSGGGGGDGIAHSSFNISAALAYLSSVQNLDGSIGSPEITDWVALAFAAENPGTALASLNQYETSTSPSMMSTTDYERHAMALEALGINPYSGTSIDYITPIVQAFDGTQIGSTHLDNDDIFALFALTHAGYAAGDSIIQKDVAFILSAQLPDGSWDESIDMTAAALAALRPLSSISGVTDAIQKASAYLKSSQQQDGGWNSIDSTSWVQTAINGQIAAGAANESSWAAASGHYPTDALADAQQSDGAVQSTSTASVTRAWSTAYAILAASGTDWNSVLKSFAQPTVTTGGGSTNTTSSASTTATTTLIVATSTDATTTTAVATTTTATSTDSTTTTPVITAVPLKLTLSPAPVPAPSTEPTLRATTIEPTLVATTTEIAATTSNQLAGAAIATSGINYGSWWFLFALIVATIFVLILLWAISNAYRNRR